MACEACRESVTRDADWNHTIVKPTTIRDDGVKCDDCDHFKCTVCNDTWSYELPQ